MCLLLWFWCLAIAHLSDAKCSLHPSPFNCTALQTCPPSRVKCGSITEPNSTSVCECELEFLWPTAHTRVCGYRRTSWRRALLGATLQSLLYGLIVFALLALLSAASAHLPANPPNAILLIACHVQSLLLVLMVPSGIIFLLNFVPALTSAAYGSLLDDYDCPTF
jgi:hypothetical protein